MKLVKLNKTHRLYHDGFTHAFRFDRYDNEASRLERLLHDRFGSSYQYNATWQLRFGHKPKSGGNRVIWLGLKTESMATMVLLSQ
jgi:hypothetical protein